MGTLGLNFLQRSKVYSKTHPPRWPWMIKIFAEDPTNKFISKNQQGLWRSDLLRQAKLCWLATLWHHEYLAARFWHFHSRSASRRRIYVASASWYLSQTRNCARLLIVATQSSPLNWACKVAWWQCNHCARDKCGHTNIYRYRCGKRKVILRPAEVSEVPDSRYNSSSHEIKQVNHQINLM